MKNINITLPLTSFIESHLGIRLNEAGEREQSWHYRTIKKELAEIILVLTKNESHCYIEFPSINSPHLTEPMLWELSAWNIHHDKWTREKIRSDRERVARFILETNVKIVARAFMELTCVDDLDKAKAHAFSLITSKKFGNIRALGVHKLITKEEELT